MRLLRSALFNLFFFTVSIALSVYGTFAARHSPARALALGRLWARLNIGAVRILCGIELRVTGREHLPLDAPALIASQHQSAYDTMIWQQLVPRAAYVLKVELTRIPLFGKLALRAGMIPVDRAGGGTAIRALLRATDRAKAEGRQIVIFPEGTRAEPDTVPVLQHGVAAMAARARLPVIPVRTDSGRVWGRRRFAKRPGTVHVEILPPLPLELGRGELMRRLNAIFAGVDNSVQSNQVEFPGDARENSQQIDRTG